MNKETVIIICGLLFCTLMGYFIGSLLTYQAGVEEGIRMALEAKNTPILNFTLQNIS